MLQFVSSYNATNLYTMLYLILYSAAEQCPVLKPQTHFYSRLDDSSTRFTGQVFALHPIWGSVSCSRTLWHADGEDSLWIIKYCFVLQFIVFFERFIWLFYTYLWYYVRMFISFFSLFMMVNVMLFFSFSLSLALSHTYTQTHVTCLVTSLLSPDHRYRITKMDYW